MLAVEAMLSGRRVLELAPTFDQTDAFWSSVKGYLSEPIAAGLIYKNETERVLEGAGLGRIRAKTARDPDTARGDWGDFIIHDEYSVMKSGVWDEVTAPMTLDTDGTAIFVFTPKRKNHAHALYTRALADDTGRWAAWRFTSFDNPYLSKQALAEISADMTQDAYRQEIMAEFLDNEGAMFRNIADCAVAKPSKPEDHAGHTFVIGADWGKHNDYTVWSIGCETCRREVELWRGRSDDYMLQLERLEHAAKRWRVRAILPERNAMGEPLIEIMSRRGLPVGFGQDRKAGFNTTATTKPPLVENLVLAFERREWQFLDNAIATAELEAYERVTSPITGRTSYSAPEGVHDDTVMARALMLWAATKRREAGAMDNPFYN